MSKEPASKTRKLSQPKRRILEYLKTVGNLWVVVPPATRSGTILSLVRAGLIELKRDPRGHCADSVTRGLIRLKPKEEPYRKPDKESPLAARLADALETAIVIAERRFYPGPVLVKEWQEMIGETKT